MSKPIDPKQLEFNLSFIGESSIPKTESKPPIIKPTEPFVGWKPKSWCIAANKLGGKTPALGDMLWFLVGVTRLRRFEFSISGHAREWGISRSSISRAIKLATDANLILVMRSPGKKLFVEVLDVKAEGLKQAA